MIEKHPCSFEHGCFSFEHGMSTAVLKEQKKRCSAEHRFFNMLFIYSTTGISWRIMLFQPSGRVSSSTNLYSSKQISLSTKSQY